MAGGEISRNTMVSRGRGCPRPVLSNPVMGASMMFRAIRKRRCRSLARTALRQGLICPHPPAASPGPNPRKSAGVTRLRRTERARRRRGRGGMAAPHEPARARAPPPCGSANSDPDRSVIRPHGAGQDGGDTPLATSEPLRVPGGHSPSPPRCGDDAGALVLRAGKWFAARPCLRAGARLSDNHIRGRGRLSARSARAPAEPDRRLHPRRSRKAARACGRSGQCRFARSSRRCAKGRGPQLGSVGAPRGSPRRAGNRTRRECASRPMPMCSGEPARPGASMPTRRTRSPEHKRTVSPSLSEAMQAAAAATAGKGIGMGERLQSGPVGQRWRVTRPVSPHRLHVSLRRSKPWPPSSSRAACSTFSCADNPSVRVMHVSQIGSGESRETSFPMS